VTSGNGLPHPHPNFLQFKVAALGFWFLVVKSPAIFFGIIIKR